MRSLSLALTSESNEIKRGGDFPSRCSLTRAVSTRTASAHALSKDLFPLRALFSVRWAMGFVFFFLSHGRGSDVVLVVCDSMIGGNGGFLR